MTVTELNEYIKHYLEEDKTHTAIMLTGEWGSRKTYYVENELAPFLQDDDAKNRCIIISLYGLESIADISKSIYMELRMKELGKNSEAKATGKLIAKTIAKGAAGIFGIDINMSENDLQKLYSSVDLSSKLLVFEDLERSNIELIKLLGYVNNLVERDGVKILLVANENEIINKTSETFDFNFTTLISAPSKSENEKCEEKSVPEEVQKYLRIKEKTISDTICFENDYPEAIKSIIKTFDNKILREIIDEDSKVIEELVWAVKGCCHNNFRTFIFATQKTVDIYSKMEENYEKDFLKSIYFGIISFSAKIKREEFPVWQGTKYLSTILGSNWEPLFKFCYDYIRWQKLDVSEIPKARDAFEEMKLYDKHADRTDEDLQKLFSYHERTESEVRNVLKNIEKRLNDPNDIGFYSYGKLAAYLVIVGHVIEFDYGQCKNCMIENIRGKGNDISSELLFLPMYELEGEEKEELKIFFDELAESMNFKAPKNNFSYDVNDIKSLYDYVIEEKNRISRNHEFICRYDVEQLVEMLFHASSKQIEDFRGVLFVVYRYAGKADFIEADANTMKEILELVEEKLNSQNYDIDRIQIKQFKWLCSNLRMFISQMS